MSTPAEGQGVAASAYRAMDHWFNSTATASNWRKNNPGEWDKLQEYRAAPPGSSGPEDIDTEIGLMLLNLIDAAKYGEGTHA